MSAQVSAGLRQGLGTLRHEPTAKRVRAVSGGRTVVDSTAAVLVWEPRRVVPAWAVPVSDVGGELVPGEQAAGSVATSSRPVLDPSVPFAVHTTPGLPVDLVVAGRSLAGAGFLPEDPDLAGYVVLDFAALDEWWEEDARNLSHPRDPFHRLDVLTSSRHVRLELDGHVLADSTRPCLLFETMLPVRFYLPPADVRVELGPSTTRTTCAYKGQASYLSAVLPDRVVPDIAWSYLQPLPDMPAIARLVAFFDERVDVTLDGVRRERPVTPWSPRPA